LVGSGRRTRSIPLAVVGTAQLVSALVTDWAGGRHCLEVGRECRGRRNPSPQYRATAQHARLASAAPQAQKKLFPQRGQNVAREGQDMHHPDSSYGNATGTAVNTPQVLTWSLIYTEPWLKNSKGWKQALLAGWKLSDMTSIYSGSSLTFGMSVSHNGLASRPNATGPLVYDHKLLDWFDIKPFAQPAPGFFGNAGVGTVLSPGLVNFNMALYKDFRIHERLFLQFRSEFFNVFNHPNFGSPNTNFGAAQFGQISNMKNPRIGELAMKLRF
jgi:hypothetical protein